MNAATQPQQPADVAGFLKAMGASGTPLLGHMVLYSAFEGTVTPDQLEGWFRELRLDEKFLPAPIRAVDAFEKVTGPSGVRETEESAATLSPFHDPHRPKLQG